MCIYIYIRICIRQKINCRNICQWLGFTEGDLFDFTGGKLTAEILLDWEKLIASWLMLFLHSMDWFKGKKYRKPWFLPLRSWGFPVKIFPPIHWYIGTRWSSGSKNCFGFNTSDAWWWSPAIQLGMFEMSQGKGGFMPFGKGKTWKGKWHLARLWSCGRGWLFDWVAKYSGANI